VRPHRGSAHNDVPLPTGQYAGPGRVILVGAGPGDPGLLTRRAAEALASADVVLHDQLIPREALDLVRPGAEVIDVGKRGGGEQVPQDETNELIVRHAQEGKMVVRLKGGDPFVFGRGGEEALLCAERGIPFEVVPGITAGVAAPAYAGIPVTHRGLAGAVAFVTGFSAQSDVDMGALAAFPGTLVFYMGVRTLPAIAEQLIAGGRNPDEPAAVIERGTLPDQRTIAATLATIATVAADEDVRAPSITIVGPVAALHAQLGGPLRGRTIAVTRAREQASNLAARLRALGARVVLAPVIRTEPLDVTLPDLAAFDLLCLTSPTGAARLLELARDARALAGPRIAAIGPGTAAALRAGGIEPDIVPARSNAEGLVEALADVEVRRVLIARAQEGRAVLPDALRARGADVELLALYRTIAEPLSDAERSAALGADLVVFASSSAAKAFHTAAGTLAGLRIASIGPATSATIRELGGEVAVEASEHTPDGLIGAILGASV
jgi:uroporphyrinogen III methyltransferase/synthase